MANQEHLNILEQGAKTWNSWRKDHPKIKPDLRRINLGVLGGVNQHEAELRRASKATIRSINLNKYGLKGINLSNADLRNTNLWQVNLSYADLRGANLQESYLRDTNFYRANLEGANLSQCLLRSTIFNSAFLDHADFSNAEINLAKFHNVDLRTAKGLTKGTFPYQPIINLATIFLSKGIIPENFLRDADIPEALIAYSKSLASQQFDEQDSLYPSKEKPIKLFYCYAREDERLRRQLEKHLAPLKREGLIMEWYDRKISPGKDYQREILLQIEASDIFLTLISPAFMNSDYCNNIELSRALEKHISGEIRVVPVILRPVDWTHTRLGELLALPQDALPVTEWKPRDKGLQDVARGIRMVVEELQEMKTKFSPEISALDEKKGVELLSLGSDTGYDNYYWEALEAFKRAVHFNPYNMDAWSGMAEAWFSLKRYQDALLVCERVLHIPTETPRYWNTYNIKAEALERLGKHEEANQLREKISQIASKRKDEEEA
ncbi:hypothetical protein KSF_061420 [Reticulibacter mediterranei]|uniref:TIR domain-containing protein n=1 Tax=Reticulibacter mediterranei TaxID=2778369 RepID=A0A8J3IQJ1_9CHLR|nr:pentapeptide repeat-containing protein [Reticulibacter mediterranei]GHO96094.1 hypothetical protein KSF_061420 [Reticulibacter mediterranei]